MKYFPIAVKLNNKRILVVGAGRVALRKVAALLQAQADILVIAPKAIAPLKRIIKEGKVNWKKRSVRRSDINGVFFVVAATNDSSVNEKIHRWCKEKGVLINVVDETKMCDFITPAVLRFKKSLIAVYTDGKSPVLSRDLKNYLKEKWGDFLSYRNRL